MIYEDGTDSVVKWQHKKFRNQGITHKKDYNNILPVTYMLNISVFITSVLLLFTHVNCIVLHSHIHASCYICYVIHACMMF